MAGQAQTSLKGPSAQLSGAPASDKLDTPINVESIARVIMSEAGIYNDTEQTAVGYTLVNRMARNHSTSVSASWHGYAHGQLPTASVRVLAKQILSGGVSDPTNGATHFYSPQVMPAENGKTKGYDVAGGLEQVDGLPTRTYKPSFTLPPAEAVPVEGAVDSEFKFYRMPGNGPVRERPPAV